mmetsp:Transcript_2222/g.7928  ORF Transcript_2222/g.7928 Transcript_2222/m.7928 type:complete len:114 (-) Transcript_2222:122-463(-)
MKCSPIFFTMRGKYAKVSQKNGEHFMKAPRQDSHLDTQHSPTKVQLSMKAMPTTTTTSAPRTSVHLPRKMVQKEGGARRLYRRRGALVATDEHSGTILGMAQTLRIEDADPLR